MIFIIFYNHHKIEERGICTNLFFLMRNGIYLVMLTVAQMYGQTQVSTILSRAKIWVRLIGEGGL